MQIELGRNSEQQAIGFTKGALVVLFFFMGEFVRIGFAIAFYMFAVLILLDQARMWWRGRNFR
jgi:hypothetical protein